MDKDKKRKIDLMSELVEVSAKPIMSAKIYWHESIYNILREKSENVKTEEEYVNVLKSELLYLRKLWNRELDTIYEWGQKGEMPEVEETNEIILQMENECGVNILDGKIVFKDGKNLNKNDLQFIERYTSIPNIKDRIKALQEDYIYLKIRDYITLNIYQFLSQNRELIVDLFKNEPKETTQRIADLVCNIADICTYPDIEND